MKINWKLAIALLCILLLFIPWICSLLGFPLPRSIAVILIFAGAFGLIFLLVIALKVLMDRH